MSEFLAVSKLKWFECAGWLDHGTRCELKHYNLCSLIGISRETWFVQQLTLLKVTLFQDINVSCCIYSNFLLTKKTHYLLYLKRISNITVSVYGMKEWQSPSWRFGSAAVQVYILNNKRRSRNPAWSRTMIKTIIVRNSILVKHCLI